MNAKQQQLKMYNGLWNNVFLKKRPVFSLTECLASYKEEVLHRLGTGLQVETSRKDMSEGELIERLAAAVQEDMKKNLSYLTRRQAYFLVECVDKPYVDSPTELSGMDTVMALVDMGWIYVFEVKENIYLVLPKELKKILKETYLADDVFFEQQKYYELSEYIEALVHLYGVYDIEQLVSVWNEHHCEEDAFTKEEAADYVKKLNGRQRVFHSEGDLIYAFGSLDLETAENMLLDLKDIPYYVPQEEEIWPLAYKKPIREAVQFQQLEQYVKRWIPQAEQLLWAAEDLVHVGLPSEAVIEEIVTGGLVDPDDKNFLTQFAFLYKKLLNDTRNWMCRGHKPYELARVRNNKPAVPVKKQAKKKRVQLEPRKAEEAASPGVTLKECLSLYDERTLQSIYKKINRKPRTSMRFKKKTVDHLSQCIMEDFNKQLHYLTGEQRTLLMFLMAHPSTERLPDGSTSEVIQSLVDAGWIYVFQDRPLLRFVFPEELRQIAKPIFLRSYSDEESIHQQYKQLQLIDYIYAFLKLCGVFDKQFLLEVWNEHHLEDSFSEEEMDEFLRMMNHRQPDFECKDELIYTVPELNSKAAQVLYKEVGHLPYFKPEKEEMEDYAYKLYNAYTAQYRRLEDYLKKHSPHAWERTAKVMLRFSMTGEDLPQSKEDVKIEGAVKVVNGKEKINEMVALYNELQRYSRNWLLRGHRPIDMEQMVPTEEENVVQFPS